MLRRASLFALPWLALAGFVGVTGCATIDGKDVVPDETGDPSTAGNGGADAGGAMTGGTTGAPSGGTTGDPMGGNTTGGDNPDAGPGSSGGDAGDSTGTTGGGTTGVTENGSCMAPYAIALKDNKASVTGVTTGKPESTSPKCSPVGGLLGDGAGLDGPDQVYRVTMPFKGTLSVAATGTSGFTASTYVLTTCGNSATEKACDFGGSLSYAAAAGAELFVYVDSGSIDNFVQAPPTAGGYSLAVSVRPEAADGAACGPTLTQAYCAGTSHCRDGKCASGAVTCGDGFVEGTEECDDKNAATGDGCAACKFEARDTCAAVPALTFRDEGTKRVAVATGSTTAATSDLKPTCGATGAVDHVYSFTLASSSTVTVTLDDLGGFDSVLAIRKDACADTATQVVCKDSTDPGETETYTGRLAAGTYFVVVDAYEASGTSAKGDYELTVSIAP